MPKKTKKEKIIAELRRKLETTKVESGEREVSTLQPSPLTTQPTTHNLPPQPTSYIIHDLRKTFFLAGLAISLELVIYWLSELGGSKFFQFLPIK